MCTIPVNTVTWKKFYMCRERNKIFVFVFFLHFTGSIERMPIFIFHALRLFKMRDEIYHNNNEIIAYNLLTLQINAITVFAVLEK